MSIYAYIVALLIGFLSCIQSAFGACAENQITTVVYANGIDNTEEQAFFGLSMLQKEINDNPNIDLSCIRYHLAYNERFTTSTNALITAANVFDQVASAALQHVTDFAANYWKYFDTFIEPPIWFADAWSNAIYSATSVYQPDLLRMESFYAAEVALGHKIVTVAHSQGNFYTNQAFEVVAAGGGGGNLHVVSVATPAHSVFAAAPYFTLFGDVITAVPGSLPPNIRNTVVAEGSISPCLLYYPVSCHSFMDSYIVGDLTRPAILGAVFGLLPSKGSVFAKKDIWTTSVYSFAPAGGGPGGGLDDDSLRVGGWGDEYRSLIQFDVSGSSFPTQPTSVKLRLYPYVAQGVSTTPMTLFQITQSWDWTIQGTGSDRLRLWWADQPSAIPAGIYGTRTAILPAPVVGSYYSIDITDIYLSWKNDPATNFGLELRAMLTSNNWNVFYSSDFPGDPALRPQLVITP